MRQGFRTRQVFTCGGCGKEYHREDLPRPECFVGRTEATFRCAAHVAGRGECGFTFVVTSTDGIGFTCDVETA